LVQKQDSTPLVWHFVIIGPTSSHFQGGRYHGTLTFSDGYPNKAPIIIFKTPNGRLKIGRELSTSDFAVQWDARLGVLGLLKEILAFMLGTVKTPGSLKPDPELISDLAEHSLESSKTDATFVELFSHLLPSAEQDRRLHFKMSMQMDESSTEEEEDEKEKDGYKPDLKEAPKQESPVIVEKITMPTLARYPSMRPPSIRSPEKACSNDSPTMTSFKRRIPEILEQVNASLKKSVAHLTQVPIEDATIPKVSIISFHAPGDPDITRLCGRQRQTKPPTVVYCKIQVDLSLWKILKKDSQFLSGLSSEALRKKAKEVTDVLFDKLMSVGQKKYSMRFIISDINLSTTEASMRAVFNGKDGNGKAISREKELEVLNLSYTPTSHRSLLVLHRMINLRKLYLDFCPSLRRSGKNIFDLLLKKDPIPHLQVLSVVGTSKILSDDWLKNVDLSGPSIERVYFTRVPGTKALGWNDVIMMQTMRDPVLLPCGHIADRESIQKFGKCSICRCALRSHLVSINPAITCVYRQDNGWKAHIVDTLRKPLDGCVLFHPSCGAFYNLVSLQKLYNIGLGHTSADEEVRKSVKGCICFCCKKRINNIRLVFPHSVEPSDIKEFSNLTDISTYSKLADDLELQDFKLEV